MRSDDHPAMEGDRLFILHLKAEVERLRAIVEAVRAYVTKDTEHLLSDPLMREGDSYWDGFEFVCEQVHALLDRPDTSTAREGGDHV